jgi:hypothetical protein
LTASAKKILASVSAGYSRESFSIAASYAPIRAPWLPGSAAVTSWATAAMYARSRGVGDPVVAAFSIDALVSSTARAGLIPAKGLPHWLSAMPQCAIAHCPSAARMASNALMASGNQNECSSATPLLKSSFRGGAQEVSNFTLALPIASGGIAP